MILSIDGAGLGAASTAYSKAVKTYNEALFNLNTHLTQALNSWNDDAKVVWEEKVKKANDEMAKVATRMGTNMMILGQIAQAVSDTETSVKTELGKM